VEYHGNGDPNDELVQFEYQEMKEAIRLEQEAKAEKWSTIIRTPGSRYRLGLAAMMTFLTNVGMAWMVMVCAFGWLTRVHSRLNSFRDLQSSTFTVRPGPVFPVTALVANLSSPSQTPQFSTLSASPIRPRRPASTPGSACLPGVVRSPPSLLGSVWAGAPSFSGFGRRCCWG
jgi:hypothetical protein